MGLYQVSAADRMPVPAAYKTEARYLGYRAQDRAKPFAHFFSEKALPLQAHAVAALQAGPVASEYGVRLSDLADVMSKPGYLPLETGYTVNADGHIVVAVLTQMPNVSAAMWDWWFGWHGVDSARYKIWHPEAHVFSAVAEDRSQDRSLTDRQRYINNCSYIDEYLGEQYSRLTVRFFDPERFGFAPSRPGETNIVARGGFSSTPLSFAWLHHQVRETEDGCEMRSRFIVNDAEILRVPSRSMTSRGGKLLTLAPVRGLANAFVRYAKGVSIDHFAPRMLHHCAQEMNHLASLLPGLYAEFRDMP